MTTCSEEYIALRNHIVDRAEECLSAENLRFLISSFQSIIKSKRRSSYINNCNDLITVLEKRCCVEEDNVELLKNIIHFFPSTDISNDVMSNYLLSRNRGRPQVYFSNFESTAPPLNSYSSNSNSLGSGSSTTVTNSNRLPEAVVKRVCEDIGTHWRDLARNLSIREGEIDEIEVRYPRSLKERAYECMKRFEKETDPYKVQNKLLDALEKCQRRDLKESVVELLSRRQC